MAFASAKRVAYRPTGSCTAKCATRHMHRGHFYAIIYPSEERREGLEGYGGEKDATRQDGSIALIILGDPVVGQALMLLLRGSGYEAKYLPASSLSQHLWLKGSDLLVLTPTPELSSEDREALVASLEEGTRSTKMPVLELATPLQETPKGGLEAERWHYVPWPCRIEELEGSIEAALSVAH